MSLAAAATNEELANANQEFNRFNCEHYRNLMSRLQFRSFAQQQQQQQQQHLHKDSRLMQFQTHKQHQQQQHFQQLQHSSAEVSSHKLYRKKQHQQKQQHQTDAGCHGLKVKDLIESNYDKYYYDIVAAKRNCIDTAAESYQLEQHLQQQHQQHLQQQHEQSQQQSQISPTVKSNQHQLTADNSTIRRQQQQQQQQDICNFSLPKNSSAGELELEMDLVENKCNPAHQQLQRMMTHFEMNDIAERLPTHLINVLSSNVARNCNSTDDPMSKCPLSQVSDGNEAASGSRTGSGNRLLMTASHPSPHSNRIDDVGEMASSVHSNYESPIDENASGGNLTMSHGPPSSKRRKHSHQTQQQP